MKKFLANKYAVILVIAAALGLGYYWYSRKNATPGTGAKQPSDKKREGLRESKPLEKKEPEPQPEPEPTPEQTQQGGGGDSAGGGSGGGGGFTPPVMARVIPVVPAPVRTGRSYGLPRQNPRTRQTTTHQNASAPPAPGMGRNNRRSR